MAVLRGSQCLVYLVVEEVALFQAGQKHPDARRAKSRGMSFQQPVRRIA